MGNIAGLRLTLVTLICCISAAFPGSDLGAQGSRRGSWNRYYRPYYQPPSRSYYRLSRPFYRIPSQPYYYYPPKHYPRATVPYRGYYTPAVYPGYRGAEYGYSASPYPAASGATYYLSSPNALYYPATDRVGDPGVVRANYSHLLFNVTPGNALIYLDNKLIGSARSFNNQRERYEVLEGEYLLRIELPGYKTFETVLQVLPDRTIHLDIALEQP